MNPRLALPFVAALSVMLAACGEIKSQATEKPISETSNFERTRLGTAIDSYIKTPTVTQSASVDTAFAELDGEIAELDRQLEGASGEQRSEAKAKATNLRAYRDNERIRYTEAQGRSQAEAIKMGAKALGNKIEDGAHKAGERVKEAAEAVKDNAVDAVNTVTDKRP